MKSRFFLIFLTLAAIAGAVSSIVMMIMACRFMELGRVVFYLTLAFACIGVVVWGITNLIAKKE